GQEEVDQVADLAGLQARRGRHRRAGHAEDDAGVELPHVVAALEVAAAEVARPDRHAVAVALVLGAVALAGLAVAGRAPGALVQGRPARDRLRARLRQVRRPLQRLGRLWEPVPLPRSPRPGGL